MIPCKASRPLAYRDPMAVVTVEIAGRRSRRAMVALHDDGIELAQV